MVSEREARTTEAADACRTMKPMQDWVNEVKITLTKRFEAHERGMEALLVRMRDTTSSIEAGQGILVELRTVIKVSQESRAEAMHALASVGALDGKAPSAFDNESADLAAALKKRVTWSFLQNQIGFTIRKIANTTAIQDHILEEIVEVIQFILR